MTMNRTIADNAILVTGANRGIGQALVEEALRRGAKRVYAGTRQPLAVNLFGPYRMTQEFLPALTRSRGAIVNVLSIAAFAALPVIPAYSVSKAAALSLTQSQRALFSGRGVSVHAVLVGPTDTEMSLGLEVPKVSPEYAARAIFDGVEIGEEEIFPHPILESVAESWFTGAVKGLERQFASLVEATPVAS
jgi:NAD(P)-dependent dehydrogenase (short-subunit alcohol dehydrogenase family)